MLALLENFVMAIARVLAIKKFRKELVRLRHPDVCRWSDRQLKHVVFRNERPWLEMLLWFMSRLDEDFRLSLSHRSDKDKIRNLFDILVNKGICTEDTLEMCVQGRVIFEERAELFNRLISMIKTKISMHRKGIPTESDRQQIRVLEVLDAKEREWNEKLKRKGEKNGGMTDDEFLEFVMKQQSIHGGFVDASELAKLHEEGRINLDEFSENFKKMLTLTPCVCQESKSKSVFRLPPEAALHIVNTLHLHEEEEGNSKPKITTEPETNGNAAKGSGRRRRGRKNKKTAAQPLETADESVEKGETAKHPAPIVCVDDEVANGSGAKPFADSPIEAVKDEIIQVANNDVFYFTGI